MIDRNNVAREKLEQAGALLRENGLDAWIIYSRNGEDPSLPLLFNAATKEETLFLITAAGKHQVFCTAADQATFEACGLYEKVLVHTPETLASLFLGEFEALGIRRFALNISEDDAMCDGLSLGLYHKLESILGAQRLEQSAVSSEEMLPTIRGVKSPSEIAIMEECSRYTTDIYDEVFAQLRVGLSEIDVGEIFCTRLRARGLCNGIGDPSEPPMVLLVRCGMSHRKCSPNNVILPGDMLVMDFSCRCNGYTSDIARTVYFLKPGETDAPPEVRRCVETAIKAVSAVIDAIKPGMKGYEVDAVGRAVIEGAGYPTIRHSVGHQVGLECHDGGTVLGPNKAKKSMCGVLRENEIYAIEPTVLQDGGLPCSIVEDNVVLTKDGCRVISKRQLELILIPYREV